MGKCKNGAGLRSAAHCDGFWRRGELRKTQGVTLEELIESGREIRGRMVAEEYGLDAEKEGDAQQPVRL